MLKPQRGCIADLSINSLHCSLLKRNNTNKVNIQLYLFISVHKTVSLRPAECRGLSEF